MEQTKEEKAVDILKYWYIMDFLQQDKFPTQSNYDKNRIAKLKKNVNNRVYNKPKMINMFTNICEDSQTILKSINQEALELGMKSIGDITVYIGKVKREFCIKTLKNLLDEKKEDAPEKNNDYIALMSFRLTSKGEYKENTFSLSPIIWAMNFIKKTNETNHIRLIDEEEYKEAVSSYNKKLLDFCSNKDIKEFDNELTGECDEVLFRDGLNALPVKNIFDVVSKIYSKYLKEFTNIEYEKINTNDKNAEFKPECIITYQLFEDEETKSRYVEEDYFGLSHHFFTEDIKLIIDQIESNGFKPNNLMNKALLNYITALYDKSNNVEKRFDILNADFKSLKEFFKHILNISNAPLGKWPSKFMPSLMQQIAINKAVGDDCTIFSVNGPPGTGKTTLLKEIVVNNIVNKAILLSSYDKPDEAFEECNFENKEGYSQYAKNYYRLKNEKINSFSILVASSNNNAVENITKEIPVQSSLLENLKSEEDIALNEIQELFTVNENKPTESFYIRDKNKYCECGDIYFTEYAKALFDEDVWGIVAVPLGNRKNIHKFYQKVLFPMMSDFFSSKKIEDRLKNKYFQIKEQFKKQLSKVTEMKQEIETIDKSISEISNKEEHIQTIERKMQELSNEAAVLKIQYVEAKKNVADMRKKCLKQRKTLKQLILSCDLHKEKCDALRNEIKEKESSISVIAKFFKTKKAKKITEQINVYKSELNTCEEELIAAENLKNSVEIKEREVNNEYDQSVNNKNLIKQRIYKNQNATNECEIEKNRVIDELKRLKSKIEEFKGIKVDDAFAENFLSNNDKTNIKIHNSNPWFTEKYNREREKLFYYAILLNKEFILSSTNIAKNLRNLGLFWQLRLGDNGERVVFSEKDRKNAVGVLIQTLFLLVPVISTTFASVNQFLKYVKEGEIGTLIVDEAGQAPPHMALGALYRAKRAIIVGDPKQIEPVVTDDLNYIRKIYENSIEKEYTQKSISVQKLADEINEIGTYLSTGEEKEWVGCPLVIHRRCISPMYDISNYLSYGGIMKQQTKIPEEAVNDKLCYENSQWINVIGSEEGDRNHFVKEQAEKVCEILAVAIEKQGNSPEMFVISPFTSVVRGIKKYLKECKNLNECISKDWINNNIGTVHTFQGKETKEVIFVLGCDSNAQGAVMWVNSNIVNVAVTRAKYRLYIIGDKEVWKNSECVNTAKEIIDKYNNLI